MPRTIPINVDHLDALLEQLEWSNDLIELILDRVAPQWRDDFPEMVELTKKQRRGINSVRAALDSYRTEGP